MSGCNCEWLGLCYCEGPPVPVMTPAKACKVSLKTERGRGDSNANQNTTSSEPTHD